METQSVRSETSFQELRKLQLSNLPLFGRENELDVLAKAAKRMREDGSSEIVFIEGPKGSGKTSLVLEIVRGLEQSHPDDFDVGNRRIFYCAGKYQQDAHREPYYVLRQALTDLCDAILNSDDRNEISQQLRDAIGSDGWVLAEAVPGVLALVGDVMRDISSSSSGSEFESSKSSESPISDRLARQLLVFLRIVCSGERKVILHIDDLQRTDRATADLLQSVLCDSELCNFMFVGVINSEEEDSECGDVPCAKSLIEAIEETERSHLSRLTVGDLELSALNELLAYVLKLDPSQTLALSKTVHRKTLGKVSVVFDFLNQLVDAKYLVYSLSTYQWKIKFDQIESKTSIADSVVMIVADRMHKLPSHIQQILMICASLSSKFDVSTLNLVLKEMPDDYAIPHTIEEELQLLLRSPVSEGIIDDLGEGSYKFSHEKIRETAYELLPKDTGRDLYHYKLGKILLRLRDNAKDGKQRFTLMATDQLNIGRSAIHKVDEKLELAEINLGAGKKARSLSAFVPAWRYFNLGISMLGDEEQRWLIHYNLCLALYTNAVEMASCLGYYEPSLPLADTVLQNAKSFRDKSPVYFAQVNLLGQHEMFKEAMELTLKLLSRTGEKLPPKPNSLHVLKNLRQNEDLMRGMSDDDILSLPLVGDARIITTMKLLNTYCVHSLFRQKASCMLLSSLRMNSMTFKHGLTRSSPTALCSYATVLANNGKIDEANRICKLAMKMIATLDAREWEANCILLYVLFTRHWREPYSVCMNHALEGYKSGMSYGDVEMAFFNSICYCNMYYYAGLPLLPVEKDCRAYCKRMLEYGRDNMYAISCPLWQLLLVLIGRTDDNTKLSGEAMDEDAFVEKYESCNNLAALQTFWIHKGQLAYIFGDYQEAERVLLKFGKSRDKMTSHVFVVTQSYFYGLTCLALAKTRSRRKYKAIARKVIKTMESWVQGGNVNVSHKLMLLYAEYNALLTNDGKKMREMYDAAIVASSRSGFVHDAALASERAGVYFHESGDTFWAAEYLTRALRLYSDWGAIGLIKTLLPKYMPIVEREESVYSEATEVLSFSATSAVNSSDRRNSLANSTSPQGRRFSTSHRGVEHFDPVTTKKHEVLSSRFFVDTDSAALTNTNAR